ncbi:hypothetical protein BHE74_00043657, partial [Ensete ventricosum]
QGAARRGSGGSKEVWRQGEVIGSGYDNKGNSGKGGGSGVMRSAQQVGSSKVTAPLLVFQREGADSNRGRGQRGSVEAMGSADVATGGEEWLTVVIKEESKATTDE